MITRLKEQLIIDEGYRQFPYRCTAGKLTIGVGRNIQDVGISKEEAEHLLENDIMKSIIDLKKIFENFENLPENVQYVLMNMRFQLGAGTFRKFKNFIKAIRIESWNQAADEMKDSLWYKQTKNRTKRLIHIMKEI